LFCALFVELAALPVEQFLADTVTLRAAQTRIAGLRLAMRMRNPARKMP